MEADAQEADTALGFRFVEYDDVIANDEVNAFVAKLELIEADDQDALVENIDLLANEEEVFHIDCDVNEADVAQNDSEAHEADIAKLLGIGGAHDAVKV